MSSEPPPSTEPPPGGNPESDDESSDCFEESKVTSFSITQRDWNPQQVQREVQSPTEPPKAKPPLQLSNNDNRSNINSGIDILRSSSNNSASNININSSSDNINHKSSPALNRFGNAAPSLPSQTSTTTATCLPSVQPEVTTHRLGSMGPAVQPEGIVIKSPPIRTATSRVQAPNLDQSKQLPPPASSLTVTTAAPPICMEPDVSVANAGVVSNGSVRLTVHSPQQQQRPPAHQQTQQQHPATLKMHPSGRELKVEDALLYLDQVKLEFGDRPRIYNEFLEIMKCFKAQEVDTVGVINRVRSLFHGYNNLILGFNTFLPDGYKIEMRDLEPVFVGPGLSPQALPGNAPAPSGPQFMQAKPLAGRGGAGGRGSLQAGRGLPMVGSSPAVQQGGPAHGRGIMTMPGCGRGSAIQTMPGRGIAGRGPRPPQPKQIQQQPQQQPMQMQQSVPIPKNVPQQQPQQPGQRAVEFDHAIMYVTNIKKRFANQPRTYHTFLEILHTYQKEQRGIKEVLEQVSSLFADHPDLLREFTFFLPDAVQEQAKERLSRAAAEAEAKQLAAVEAATKIESEQLIADSQEDKQTQTGWRATKEKPHAHPPPLSDGAQKFIDMTQPGDAPSPQKLVLPGRIQKTEAFVYNSGVERQFFDSVKFTLSSYSRDGQAYAEFIKTLDMYAQEILSRNDMLGYVERLLGKHRDLFEQFKCIITAVGAPDAPAHDDSWHSVPLSEIDFSRCRRCSPSYRALPRDYPNPPCSERSEEELQVLNDLWVSLPVGSEESYTFRHMRKNQYEEVLFRSEDMRFEIDMCIEGNTSTLQRLSKIYDELKLLSENETLTQGSFARKGSDGAGLGGKTYQYTLDGRVLGVIHKHTIKRIYGDDGHEMLDLCFRNPAVAIPVVVRRLRQKDKEWRSARDALNRKWKDLAEFNYYKSLDHRSITWRAADKKATSTRTLVAEIKDRAVHNGIEGDATVSAKKDKAKEEHGSFYEVTMGSSLAKKLDLTDLPKPTKTLFTPHLSTKYCNNSWSQRDAYRIICFALERGSASPTDKERCYRMWRDFLAQWFGLDLNSIKNHALQFTPSISEEDHETENGESAINDQNGLNSATKCENKTTQVISNDELNRSISVEGLPYPPDNTTSTKLGEAKRDQSQGIEGTNDSSLSYVSTFMLPADVSCTTVPAKPSSLTDQLRLKDDEILKRQDDNLMIGTQCLYLFFRLHQILIRRLNTARDLASAVSNDPALGRHIEKLSHEGDTEEGQKRYEAFISLVYSLLDGGGGASEVSDGGKFDDRVRSLLGNQSYELTTMDKLIPNILKNLQHMANDDTLQSLIEINQRHKTAGSFKPSAFREEAALLSEGENMYAFQICDSHQSDEKIVHYEFLGCIADADEDDVEQGEEQENSNKRGIDDDLGQPSSKRPRSEE